MLHPCSISVKVGKRSKPVSMNAGRSGAGSLVVRGGNVEAITLVL
jgi:hypothetical protein